MLGLRKSLNTPFTVRRKNRSSNASSLVLDEPEEQPSSPSSIRSSSAAMSAVLPAQSPSPLESPAISVKEKHSHHENGNGATNGHVSANGNGAVTSNSVSSGYFGRVKNVFTSVTSKLVRLDDYNETYIKETDLRAYLHFISDERLIHMPRRGSDWDRVLSNAQFFGLQVWLFGKKIDSYVPGGKDSAAAALASCQILLEVGHAHASALLPTFIALYELAMMLSTVGQLRNLEDMPPKIKEAAADIFCDLVSLTGSIAVHYRRKISSLRAGSSIVIDFDAAFGKEINEIWTAKYALHDAIWAHALGRKRFSIDLPSLREKLTASGEVSVRGTLYDEVSDSLERSEDTCHWIKHELVQFLQSNEQVLKVTGEAGTGKTMLAEWVQERLTRPLDHKSYTVLDYNFEFDDPNELTALACVKSLLGQLLERSVGDVSLYEQLVQAFESFEAHKSSDKLEAALWNALRSGLQASDRDGAPVVIITDGCDAIIGGERKVLAFHNALRKSVSGIASTRVITFSRAVSHLSEGCRHVTITPQALYEDIRVHLWQTVSKSGYWDKLDPATRDQLIEELVAKSKGSFLWAFYAGRLFQSATQQTQATLRQSLTSDVSSTLSAIIPESRIKNDDTLKQVLSLMLVLTRPLTVQEFAAMLATNTQSRALDKQILDLLKYIPQQCGDIIVIRGGRLHLRSSTVRNYLQGMMGKALPSWKNAQLQIVFRILLYARIHLTGDREPSLDDLEDSVVDELLQSNPLLLYVLQNWTAHFRETGLIAANGDVTIPQGFADVLPDSVTFALLERMLWYRYFSDSEIVPLHELVLKIRKSSFGNEHVTVMQTLITLAFAHRRLSVSTHSSAIYLVLATRIGLKLFTASSSIVASSTTLFLTWTESITITERTEIVTYREEMIKVMISVCRHKYGKLSHEVEFWLEALAKLYTAIREEHNATIYYRELLELIKVREGPKSTKAKQIGAAFGSLDLVLEAGEAEKDIGQLEVLIFETNEDVEVSDKLSISMTIRLAATYVAAGKLFLAERLYINLWRRISASSKTDSRLEIHIAKIQIAIEYVKFLRKLNRTEEASNILITLWAEYEHFSSESKALMVWIREIGTLSKSFGLLTISASIFTKVWGWFKSKGKADDEEAQRTTVLITEVVEEITETTITKKTTKITTTEVTETAVKEIYEMQYERCKKTKADSAFFSSCMALLGVYIKNKNWAEAETISTKTLEITWKAIFSADLKISLSQTSVKENITIARRLAWAYHQQGLVEKAEQIYLRIYYACLVSTTLEQETLSETIATLIAFYEEHHRHEKVIEIYVEVLEKYRKTLGHSHRLTISTLYLLAAQCELLGRTDASKYYLEIVTVLNKGIKHCHPDAMRAALFLCRYYNTRKMWTELRAICVVVWETVVSHREQAALEMEVITEIYKMYAYVLEVHAHVEFSVLYKMTVQYRDVVSAVSGALSVAYLLALIELAKVCEKHESHYHESISIYEEVIKKTKTVKTTEVTITETTIQTVKKRLSTMYVTVITTGKGGAATKPTLERAIEISLEAYAQLKIEFGCWHEKTLLKLKEVVLIYHKITTQESKLRITQLLQESVTEIITTVTVTATLFSSAKLLASIYISVGQVDKGQQLLHQLRHLVIFRGRAGWASSDITLQLNAQISRAAFTFLLAFELGLLGDKSTVTYSMVMADLIYEVLLFDEYARVIEKETSLDIILERGAKLRGFWEEHRRSQLLVILDAKLLQLFQAEYQAAFKSIGEEHVRIFYLAILSELAKDQRATRIDFPTLACEAGTTKVKVLLQAGQFRQAHEVGRAVFRFAAKHQLYRRRECIQYGYKLAELLAGIDIAHPTDANSQDIKRAMLVTSRDIMTEVLTASRAAQIDFAALRFDDLAGLIRLLGAQGNFVELEALLSRLWSRREELQRSSGWSPTMVLHVGSLLVHAQQSHGNTSAATATAELLYYNVRRGRGRLDPETLAVSRLLASLYLSSGRAASAMGVYEGVLREIVFSCHDHGETPANLVAESKLLLELLKEAHHRSMGKGRPVGELKDLFDRLKTSMKMDLPAFEQWIETNKTTQNGNYVPVREWKITRDAGAGEAWKRSSARQRSKQDVDVVQATSQWWKIF